VEDQASWRDNSFDITADCDAAVIRDAVVLKMLLFSLAHLELF
jgi:hypothetical protein